jgi:glycosyltransferase involved in cell wall biosynthesis
LRINFILPFYSSRPIGGLKVAYEYANQLAARGHAVSVIHPRFMRNVKSARSGLRRLQTAAMNTRNVLSSRSGLKWQPLEKSVRILHVSEPTAQNVPDADIVFATAWQTAEYVFKYPAEKGSKFYVVMDFEPWIASKEILENTWNWPLKKITISKWLYDQVRAAGCPAADVENIPIGINFDQFQLLQEIPNRPKKIAMLYSVLGSKGSDDGLKALQQCKQKHPDLEVVLFGPTSRLRPPGLPDWADYKGNIPQPQLTQLFNESSVYVCSSLAEGFALPPAEAMACGCAVVATDCGGIREFARDGENILLSAPRDPDGLARNILRLLDDEQLRVSLARNGREFISQFTWSTATERLEQVMMDEMVSGATN